jgi:predicted nucleic acid-binding protein
VIVDTSVWIDFSRGESSPQVEALSRAISARTAMVTDPVRLEVLAGVAGGAQANYLAAALDGCQDLRQEPRTDVEAAASIYRRCRQAGEMIRSLNDCLIAAIAIRHDVPVLHHDRDFDAIARHSALLAVRS